VKRWRYPALAFLTGAAVTVFEFSAPNLFRAYFGQTLFVWANVIGVILGALALGYAVGGRWADRTTTSVPLFSVLAAAGAYAVLAGWLGPDVAAWLAGPEEYTQDAALGPFFAQSLAASLLLFAVPLALLGTATPLLVQRASAAWPVGTAAGLVFGVGTLGSIAGIYLTTFVFLDAFGVRLTVSGAGGALLVIAAVGLARRRGPSGAAPLLGLVLVPLGARPPWDRLPPEGSTLVLAIESPYQLVRVVDRPGPPGARPRWLAFDEGMGTYHSMQLDATTGWTGAYYDVFVKMPEWVGGAGALRICIVGNAAGTMSKILHFHHDPATLAIDGVEIDPAVTEAARRTMGLLPEEHPSLRVVHADGRTFLRGCAAETYDAIVLDAYARQVSIPPALATREFFALARSRLREGGMLFVNLGALRPGGTLVRTIADTMAAAFGTPIARCPLDGQQNVLLVARRGGAPPPPPPSTPLGVPDSFAIHVPGDRILTDDRCPVERLTAQDLLVR
jgi:MFS family permease